MQSCGETVCPQRTMRSRTPHPTVRPPARSDKSATAALDGPHRAHIMTIEFHAVAMKHDICFIEVMENFDELEQDVFFISALPLPFKGLDSCPVRVVAIEGLPGFDK